MLGDAIWRFALIVYQFIVLLAVALWVRSVHPLEDSILYGDFLRASAGVALAGGILGLFSASWELSGFADRRKEKKEKRKAAGDQS